MTLKHSSPVVTLDSGGRGTQPHRHRRRDFLATLVAERFTPHIRSGEPAPEPVDEEDTCERRQRILLDAVYGGPTLECAA